jgi:hypothetical protein
MSVDLSTIGVLVSVVATIVSGYYALAALIVRQFKADLDQRFKAQDAARLEGRKVYEDRLAALEKHYHELHTSFLKHLAELPREYVRREDHIRFETVITAKLDALYSEMRLMAERQQTGRG